MKWIAECRKMLLQVKERWKYPSSRIRHRMRLCVIFFFVLVFPCFNPILQSRSSHDVLLNFDPSTLVPPANSDPGLVADSDALLDFLTQHPSAEIPTEETDSGTDADLPSTDSTEMGSSETDAPIDAPANDVEPDDTTTAPPQITLPETNPPKVEPSQTTAPETKPPKLEPPQAEETNKPTVSEPTEEETDPRESMSLDDLPVADDYYYRQEIVPLTKEQQAITIAIAKEYALPTELLYAIMQVETHYTVDLISATNDYGIMQINVCNHEMMTKRLGVTDFLDFEQNVRCGAYMLYLCQNYSETLPQLLMCYNRGVGGAKKAWKSGITFDTYCEKVISELEELLAVRNADQ